MRDVVHASRRSDSQAAVGTRLDRVAAGDRREVDDGIRRDDAVLDAGQQVGAAAERLRSRVELSARVSE